MNSGFDLSGRLRGMLAGDLVLVVAVVIATDLLFVFGVDRPLVRVVTGTPFVLLCPGYALVAALFPESKPAPVAGGSARVGGAERLLLAVGLSIVLSPLLGLALNYTPAGLAPAAVVATISAFTLTVTVVAAWRRSSLAPERRFTLGRWNDSMLGVSLTDRDSASGTVAAVVVLAALVAAVGGVGWTVYERPPGETFTEFYVLDDGGSGAVMDDYPDRLTIGETTSVRVGVANEEHRTVTYTVVTSLQEVRRDDGVSAVVTSRELDRTRTPTLRDGEEWVAPIVFTPSVGGKGESFRLTFSLYVGDAPETPTIVDPYRQVYLRVGVDAR